MVGLMGASTFQFCQNHPGKVSHNWAIWPRPSTSPNTKGLAAIDRDLLHPVEIVGGELVCFGVAEAGQGQRVAVHGSESGGVALSRRIAGG